VSAPRRSLYQLAVAKQGKRGIGWSLDFPFFFFFSPKEWEMLESEERTDSTQALTMSVGKGVVRPV